MRDEHDRYEVGYGKPPKATQFPKGKSPNPGGRPKGSKSWKTLADEVLNERITVIVQGKPRKMTMKKAITRQAVHDAIRNNDLKKLNMMGVFKEQIETPQQSIDEQPEQFSCTLIFDSEPQVTTVNGEVVVDHRLARVKDADESDWW